MRGARHDHQTQRSRCRHRWARLDRRDSLQGTRGSRPQSGRAGARCAAFERERLFAAQYPRRAALCRASRSDAKHRTRHHHRAQQSATGGAADAPPRLVPARRSRRRLRRALERPHLALDRYGIQDPLQLRGALRQEIHPRRHDDPGLGHQLRRTRALLRQVRIYCGGLRQGRQYRRPDPGRRQSVRSAARPRLSIAAANPDSRERNVHRCGAQRRLSSVPAAVGERLAALHQPGRREIRRLPVLRLLPAFWLRSPTPRAARI